MNITPTVVSEPSFRELCDWIKLHTNKESLFLTEPFSKDSAALRSFCKRAVYSAREDGGQVVFDRKYAMEYMRRRSMIATVADGMFAGSDPVFREVDFVISNKPLPVFDNNTVFQNEEYVVYKMVDSL